MSQFSYGMNFQFGKMFGGLFVDVLGISDFRDGLDFFFDCVIGNFVNEVWIMFGIDV